MNTEARFLSDAWKNGNKVRLTITPLLDDEGNAYWKVSVQGVQMKEGTEYPIEGAVRSCQIVAASAKDVLDAFGDLVCRSKIVNIGGISPDDLDKNMKSQLKARNCQALERPLSEITDLFKKRDESQIVASNA